MIFFLFLKTYLNCTANTPSELLLDYSLNVVYTIISAVHLYYSTLEYFFFLPKLKFYRCYICCCPIKIRVS